MGSFKVKVSTRRALGTTVCLDDAACSTKGNAGFLALSNLFIGRPSVGSLVVLEHWWQACVLGAIFSRIKLVIP